MNDQSTSCSQQQEVIETIVFEPIHCSAWNQTAIEPMAIHNHHVRLVSFDGPHDLCDKLQELMTNTFHNDNQDNYCSTSNDKSLLSTHRPSHSSSLIDGDQDLNNYSPNYNHDEFQESLMEEEDNVDWNDFDKSNFTFGPISCKIPVIPEPPTTAMIVEREEFMGEQRQGKATKQPPEPTKTKALRRTKGIKLEDVLRTRVWGKRLRLSSKQQRPRPSILRRQTSCSPE